MNSKIYSPSKTRKAANVCLSFLLALNTASFSFAFSLDDLADKAVQAAGGPPDVKKLALQGVRKLFTPQTLPDYPQERISDAQITNYVVGVRKNLDQNAINKGTNIIILKTAKVNGMGGWGTIEITRGLLNMMKNEAELACLIGHEIGHEDLIHLGKVNDENYQASAASKGIVFIGNALGEEDAAETANDTRGKLAVANYGQQLEQDADEYGAVLAAKAGYDPYAFVDLFSRLAQKRGTGVGVKLNGLTEGHKTSDVRAKHLLEYLKAKGYEPDKGKRNENEFQNAMADLASIHTGEGGKDQLPDDQKKDVADLQQIDMQLQQAGQNGTKISPEKFRQVMRRYSQYIQKYKITREQLLAASKDLKTRPKPAKSGKHFMDDDLDQDYPFFDTHSPDGLGPAGKFLVEGLDLVAKTALTITAPGVMIPIMAFEAIDGHDVFMGDKLSNGQRVLSGLGAFAAAGSEVLQLSRSFEEMAKIEGMAKKAEETINQSGNIYKNGTNWNLRSAEDVNNDFVIKGKEAPYQSDQDVLEFSSTTERKFFRVHTEDNQKGSWLVDFDPSKYSQGELKDMLALPELPTQYSGVIVPAGANLRVSVAGAVKKLGNVWGNGGAIQFELMDGRNANALFELLGILH